MHNQSRFVLVKHSICPTGNFLDLQCRLPGMADSRSDHRFLRTLRRYERHHQSDFACRTNRQTSRCSQHRSFLAYLEGARTVHRVVMAPAIPDVAKETFGLPEAVLDGIVALLRPSAVGSAIKLARPRFDHWLTLRRQRGLAAQ